jgi:hypothetical protein
VDRHTDSESAATDNHADIHKGYPSIRDNPQKKPFPPITTLFTVHPKWGRNPSEHLKQRRTRKPTSGGTATKQQPQPHMPFKSATQGHRKPADLVSTSLTD